MVGAQNDAGMTISSFYKFYPAAFSFGGEYTHYLYTPEKDIAQGNIFYNSNTSEAKPRFCERYR